MGGWGLLLGRRLGLVGERGLLTRRRTFLVFGFGGDEREVCVGLPGQSESTQVGFLVRR